jgi:hypothetical protein
LGIIARIQNILQLGLFASPIHAVAEAMDNINDRWGKFVITPALMMEMGDIILDRIFFGSVKEFEEIYLTFPLCCFDHISCWLPRNTP